jgi:hypothetical protein
MNRSVSILKQSIFPLLLFLLPPILPGMDIRVTGKEAGFNLRAEYNRAFYYCGDLAIFGAAGLNDRYTVKSGFALGNAGEEFDIRLFTAGDAALPVPVPLYFNLGYIYNGLPGYETHSHSILPLVSLRGRWAGIALGTSLRFTTFFDEPPLFESTLSFSGYVNFYLGQTLRLGLRCANFDDFSAGNMGSYFINLNSAIRLNALITLVSEIELLQSGSSALSANFYGLACRGGIQFSW